MSMRDHLKWLSGIRTSKLASAERPIRSLEELRGAVDDLFTYVNVVLHAFDEEQRIANARITALEATDASDISIKSLEVPWPEGGRSFDIRDFANLLVQHNLHWRDEDPKIVIEIVKRKLENGAVVVGNYRLRLTFGPLGHRGQAYVYVVRTPINGGGS